MNDRLAFRIILIISIIVFVAVLVLNRKLISPPAVIPSFAYTLPKINAFINAICTILLFLSLNAIKKKNITLHKILNLTTFALSALFLIFYVTFHYLVQETHYGGSGAIKAVYYFVLITHIITAAIVLPLVLYSFYHALQGNLVKHRKIAKWAWPIWIYVTFTGVIVYLMISPYDQF